MPSGSAISAADHTLGPLLCRILDEIHVHLPAPCLGCRVCLCIIAASEFRRVQRIPMKTIELDDDLYFYIASQTRHIGESASDILRRLLEQPAHQGVPVAEPVAVAQPSAVATQQGLQALLDSGELQKEEKSINRFMLVLSTLYRDNPEGFTQATEIKGRKRVYFSQDPEALRASGSTTKPKPVPETPFWVITNTNTSRKQNMVAQLMASMGYGEEMIAQVCGAI
ncbi:replication initiation regulator SeqA [Aeromonas veronii]|uniref:Negative modulator of initiation of replication n=2 Tax=Aeromonas veronii TaxID=654 RepID=A0ABY3MPS8_AERVE|nr:replication initiation regulator SeqA [Aeromonas veronii]RDU90371.1 replication initiation regulator SeqA [Aeromonas veronii]TEY56543.1 replication initiation regulator SeqA [Aeromonas veronii]TEY83872.1 replication initiation regulator SeqA [Aeromonas veronii]TYD46967.1 replication initiation regulator SeqA [Aeromonas veronii]